MRRFIVNAVSDVIAEQPCLQGGPEDDALLEWRRGQQAVPQAAQAVGRPPLKAHYV